MANTTDIFVATKNWQAFTPTGSWTTNTTYTGFYRRVGDTLEMQIQMSFSGAPASGNLTVNLPSGLTVDATKIASAAANAIVGSVNIGPNATQAVCYYGGSSILQIWSLESNTGSAQPIQAQAVTPTVPQTFGATSGIEIFAKVPIVGWSAYA